MNDTRLLNTVSNTHLGVEIVIFELIHIDKSEHVQRYFTFKGYEQCVIWERSLNRGLESLKVRRLRSHLIIYFKILHELC